MKTPRHIIPTPSFARNAVTAFLALTLLAACPAPTPTASTPVAVTVPVPQPKQPTPTPPTPPAPTQTTAELLDAQFPDTNYTWAPPGDELIALTKGAFRGIRVYALDTPEPHWLFVTDGASPPAPATAVPRAPDALGRIELTLRVPRAPEATEFPSWGLQALANLVLYLYNKETGFRPGEFYDFQGFIIGAAPLAAVVFTQDPQIPNAQAAAAPAFLHAIAIPADDFEALTRWNPRSFTALLADKVPFVVSDPKRPSLMSDAQTAERIEAAIATEGSSYGIQLGGDVTWTLDPTGKSITVIIAPSIAERLRKAVTTLFTKGRPLIIGSISNGVPTSAAFGPADKSGWRAPPHSNDLRVMFDGPTAARLATALESGVTFEDPEMPGFRLEVR